MSTLVVPNLRYRALGKYSGRSVNPSCRSSPCLCEWAEGKVEPFKIASSLSFCNPRRAAEEYGVEARGATAWGRPLSTPQPFPLLMQWAEWKTGAFKMIFPTPLPSWEGLRRAEGWGEHEATPYLQRAQRRPIYAHCLARALGGDPHPTPPHPQFKI